ncbi:hypothetical protein [Nocardiopsis synnemataformans]|uniref:hypothetical protein n=1 Tax=Nocardiopsis synnemataformans TaxID=61305 RepID=UPI003EBF3BBC
MSEYARTRLQKMWSGLEFFTVESIDAREPDDVCYIELRKPPIGTYANGKPMYNDLIPGRHPYKRLQDVPAEHRPHARVVWESFRGRTTDGVAFNQDSHHKLDFTDYTLTFRDPLWSDATWISNPPDAGQLICGVREASGRLGRWFVCDDAFRLLVEGVRNGPPHTEQEYAHLLLTDGYPDTYFAVARLVFFDQVQAFVDGIKVGKAAPTTAQLFMGAPRTISTAGPQVGQHPAYGMTYAGGYKVDWRGMYLGTDYSQFVHELSHSLGEPAWWDNFLALAADQGVVHSHPSRGGTCQACMAADPNWPRNGFPYSIDSDLF